MILFLIILLWLALGFISFLLNFISWGFNWDDFTQFALLGLFLSLAMGPLALLSDLFLWILKKLGLEKDII